MPRPLSENQEGVWQHGQCCELGLMILTNPTVKIKILMSTLMGIGDSGHHHQTDVAVGIKIQTFIGASYTWDKFKVSNGYNELQKGSQAYSLTLPKVCTLLVTVHLGVAKHAKSSAAQL